MSARFGPAAMRLCALSMRALGWRPDDFWNATPAELAAILAPEAEAAPQPLTREELGHLMERDNAG